MPDQQARSASILRTSKEQIGVQPVTIATELDRQIIRQMARNEDLKIKKKEGKVKGTQWVFL
jgi:hypothetical protein